MNTTTHTTSQSGQRPTLSERLFASIYDPFVWLGERRVMRGLRHELLAQARGLTVEIGGGTGLNLQHYPDDLDKLVIAEPDPGMRARLERRVQDAGRQATVVDAPAERLPFEAGTVDTVVSTLVLCTVESPELAMREIARVLKADGQLLFIEHVQSSSRVRSWWQDRLEVPWRKFAGECRCNRPTVASLAQRGFALDVSEAAWRGMPAIVKPLVYGSASWVDTEALSTPASGLFDLDRAETPAPRGALAG
jgi:SAM-dependent methyltransferase